MHHNGSEGLIQFMDCIIIIFFCDFNDELIFMNMQIRLFALLTTGRDDYILSQI